MKRRLVLLVLCGAVSVAPAASADRGEAIAEARRRLRSGDPTGAAQALERALAVRPPDGTTARTIAAVVATSTDGNAARVRANARMLNAVEAAWAVPSAPADSTAGSAGAPVAPVSPLGRRLTEIILPEARFGGLGLAQVVEALSALSATFDPAEGPDRGVNLAYEDPEGRNPPVHLAVRRMALGRVLELAAGSVGFAVDVEDDVVVVRPATGPAALDTRTFPLPRAAALRLAGRAGPAPVDARGGAAVGEDEGAAIRRFLQLAGVDFAGTAGSALAFDGSLLVVTQTRRNLARVERLLARYRELRQVEIEAKFMEVQDGVLEELGVNWSAAKKPGATSGARVADLASSNRSLAGAFTNAVAGTAGAIVRSGGDPAGAPALNLPIPNHPPPIPGTNNLGLGANALATVSAGVGEFNVNAVVRALAQRSGTELLSAPRLTVLSGQAATITVAQELRFPQSYGQVQSQVGTGSASGGGAAGVTITAGTPQDFATRHVGVELRVTPTVEEDGRSISLELHPRVTEFEGFVEYGGQSVAVAGGSTVTVPSGFYQPIFAVREVTTRVTLRDGATLVMGGLTREDTRKAHDKVPVVGNLPVLGRLFRSGGESAQKRNLLIFVTARRVDAGGAGVGGDGRIPANDGMSRGEAGRSP